MAENTNKALVINSIISYVRLVITMVCSLISTRLALQALGVSDFGLYSVVASVIVFAGILNTSLLSACNRFIANAVGKGDNKGVNEVFNVSFTIHLCVALLTIIFATPIGHLYIKNFVNYDGNISVALDTFYISIIATAVSFIGVPFNAIMMARERFAAFCITDSMIAIARVLLCFCLYVTPNDERLLIYAVIMGISTALPTIIYLIYCKRNFKDIVRFNLIKDTQSYKEILFFSIWTGYGAVVQVGQVQFAALLVNAFYNTIMNTALGIANFFKSAILMLSDNLTKPIAPQITKSYAAGNYERCAFLMIEISKIAFALSFMISTPLLIKTDYILTLWLGEIPPYSVLFSRLTIFTILVGSLNKGIAEYIFAGGKIKWYQIITNSLLLFSVIVGYIVLKLGAPAYTLLIVYLIFEIIAVFARQVILYRAYKFNNMRLYMHSYYPSLKLVLLSIPVLYLSSFMHDILSVVFVAICQIFICWFVTLNKNERNYIIKFIRR